MPDSQNKAFRDSNFFPHPRLSRVVMFWGWNKVQEHQQFSSSNSPRSRKWGAICQGYVRSHPKTISHWQIKAAVRILACGPKAQRSIPFSDVPKVARGILPRCLNSAMEKVFMLHGSNYSYPFRKCCLLWNKNYIYTIIKFLWWRMNGNWNLVFHLLCLPQDMLTLINICSNYHSQADYAIFLNKTK